MSYARNIGDDARLTTHDAWIKHSYLMDHWQGLRDSLASYELALAESTQKYHDAAPLRAKMGITISAPLKRSDIAIEAARHLKQHDKIEAMLEKVRA